MATTGTYAYNPTASTIITDALRLLGVLEEGSTASQDQITDCLPAFEMYIKGMGKYGLLLWTIATESITLNTTSTSYIPTNKFLTITDVVYRDADGEDNYLTPLTREEYWNLPDKDTTSSEPTQWYYDPKSTQGTSKLYIWPIPDSTGAGSGETLEVTGQLLLQDVDSGGLGANTIDVPQEWLETIKYGVATRLAPMYGYPTQERSLLLKEYQQMLNENLMWDTEHQSIYFQPTDRGMRA